jgi:DNA-binding response OmpR family regulator
MGSLDCDVLIVEDDDVVAEAIRDGVRVAGYEVCGVAANVDAAVELTRRRRPRLAIVDVELGEGEDGIEAARQMLAIAPMGIVYVTGYPDRIRDTDVGHAWMAKPYRLIDLINALNVVRALSAHAPVTAPIPAGLHLIR